MDKLEILLDMIEHPERYTEQQISDLLADEEMRKHYDVMVRLRGAYEIKKEEDLPLKPVQPEHLIVPSSWHPVREGVVTFEDESTQQAKLSTSSINKGNSYSSLFTFHSSLRKIAAIFLAAAFLGCLAWAFVPHLRSQRTAEPSQPTQESAPSLQGMTGGESVLFTDSRLDSMLTIVAAHYGKAVFFGNEDLKGLRIHTKWNPKDNLEAFMESLNELDGLKLTEQRDTIFVQKGGVQ